MYRVSVVIPALNEAENLPLVLPAIPTWVHEVILVDGGSTDATVGVARSLLPGVRVVPQEGRGKGSALRTGFAACTGDIIVMLDADGSTDPREIPAFVEALVRGADYAKGSRFLRGGGTTDITFVRMLGNAAFLGMVAVLFRRRFTDLCYGYNAFWTRIVPDLELDATGFEIETSMNLRAVRLGLRIVEVPSFEHPRVHGVSNLRTLPDGWRVLRQIVRERFARTRRAVEAAPRSLPHRIAISIVPERSGSLASFVETLTGAESVTSGARATPTDESLSSVR
jgi:glycosyltransferase involved in cell wall biosynthesis